MSRSAEVRLPFAGEERLFRLGIGQVRAVQERCDAGPLELLGRIKLGTWRVDDVREVLFQGLKGGGLSDAEATRLVAANFDPGPWLPFAALAQAVIAAGVVGAEDEPLGERAGEGAAKPTRSPGARSASPTGTGRGRRSAGPRATSTPPASGS